MTSKLFTFRYLVATGILCLFALVAASGCTDDADPDTRLPAGKYPMTFTAAVEGLTATRATTDGKWEGTEEVAIQIGTGTTPKKYKAASNGSLTVESGDPFYWQNTGNITVNAWYPYNDTKPADNALTVNADQSNDANYQASDYLEAKDAIVTFKKPELTFTHRTAKVVVTLIKGEGISNLDNAAVTFVNLTGVSSGSSVISRTETKNGATTYTALLVPQQITQKTQFIKVTIGTGDVARDYFYTPETGVSLVAGHVHTYNITVKKDGLQVTEGTSASWTETPVTVTPDLSFVFHITAPASGVKITTNTGTLSGSNGSYTLSGGNEITITVNEGTSIEIKGLYDISENTYTLKSDLLITIASPQP